MKIKTIIIAFVLTSITTMGVSQQPTMSESSCQDDTHFMTISIKKESELTLYRGFALGCKAYISSLYEVGYINDTTELKEGMKVKNITYGTVNIGHEFYIKSEPKDDKLFLQIEFKEVRLISHDNKKKPPKTEQHSFTINDVVTFNDSYKFTRNGLEYELKIYK